MDVLLRAFTNLVEKNKDAYLVIAGSVWKADFHECEEIISSHDFDGRLKTDIRYIPDEEVKYYYRRQRGNAKKHSIIILQV